jgi:hypothetical protein
MHIIHTIFNKKTPKTWKKKDIKYLDSEMSLKLKVKKNLPRRSIVGLTKNQHQRKAPNSNSSSFDANLQLQRG